MFGRAAAYRVSIIRGILAGRSGGMEFYGLKAG